MHAFSVGYAGRPENDERADAKALANHLGMPFHDVEITTEDVVDSFGELNYWRDDPIADIAGLGYLSVMRLAREHGVPVVLQGQGGDELFWGYFWVRDAAVQSRRKLALQLKGWRALPSYVNLNLLPEGLDRPALSRWVRSSGGILPSWRQYRHHRTAPKDRIVFYDLAIDFQIATRERGSIFTKSLNEQVFDGSAAEPFTIEQPWANTDVTITRLICDTFLRENGIAQGDRLSMASSIELRLPLVDYKLVETVIGLRKAHSDIASRPKTWFREAVSDLLPEWVMNRRKRGFSPPVNIWQNELFKRYGDTLRGGYLVENAVLNPHIANQFASNTWRDEGFTSMSFKALVLEQWCRQMQSVHGARKLEVA
jgi:asparagine synthase (glutamine-hydrolysing)